MTELFGWCLDGLHTSCPGTTTSGLACTCPPTHQHTHPHPGEDHDRTH